MKNQGKLREFEVNGYGSVQKIFWLREEDELSRNNPGTSTFSLGATFKGKNLLPRGANFFPSRVNPFFQVIQLALLSLK